MDQQQVAHTHDKPTGGAWSYTCPECGLTISLTSTEIIELNDKKLQPA